MDAAAGWIRKHRYWDAEIGRDENEAADAARTWKSALQPVNHPNDEDLSLGTPVNHPNEEDLSLRRLTGVTGG
jgi:hypothetical protein